MTSPSANTDIVAKPRRSPWSASQVALIVIVGLFASVAVHLKLTHDKAIRDAETLVTALAIASEQHIGGNLAGIDALLDELAATVREGRHRDQRFSQDFSARLSSFPEVRFIGILGADGALQPDSWPPYRMSPEGISLAHRSYFSAQRDAVGPAAMLVGEPAYMFSTNEHVLHLSRPIRDKAGRFAGVVFASVNPDIYAAFLASIQFDDAGGGSLLSLNGQIVALGPDPRDRYGHDVSTGALFRTWLPQAPIGIAHLDAEAGEVEKLVAYRVMPEFSLMVTAGISTARTLGEWRRMATVELALMALFSCMLLYWTRRIARHEDILGQQQSFMEDAVLQRSRALEDARALAESRATRLGRINDELKRLTLVTSHHLQEPLRAVVSCGQMIPRSLPSCPPALQDAIEDLGRQGLALKRLLTDFEKHVETLTWTIRQSGQDAEETPAPVPAPEPEPASKNDHSTYTARAIAAVVALTLLGGNAWQVRADYYNSLRSAETLTSAVANSLERHLQASFRRIGILLDDLALAVEDGRHTSSEFHDRLLSRMETVPEIRQLSVADANGMTTPWSWSADGTPVHAHSIADRDFFQDQAAARKRDLVVIGQPRPEGPTGERLIHFSRPLIGPAGQFDGVVVAAVETDLYGSYLEMLLLDADGGSAVITLKGRLVARAPKHTEKFGLDISNSDLFTKHLPQAPSGVARLVSKTDGNEKLLGYRVIDGFPLLVTSGYSRQRALAQWKVVAVMASGLALLSSAILFAWAWRADRRAQKLSRYRGQLAAEVAKRTSGLAAAHHAASQRAVRLADANAQMQDLIRLIAADMQAPLRSLNDRIAAVKEMAAGQSEECDHWLGYITAGGIHLRALMRDYQRFVATLSDTPRLRELDSGEIARGAAASISDVWGERVTFRIGTLPRLPADRDMLLELFLQLFANAATHAARERPVTVTVEAERDGDGWRFTVADDGPGLPPVSNDQLFRAFETARDRDPDSTGLGLPLCRVIVQGHGGRIWAGSRAGRGCDIHFVLPDGNGDRFPLAGNSAPA
ncbi:MAG: ATP-binding protein [Bacteroidota bacterium]